MSAKYSIGDTVYFRKNKQIIVDIVQGFREESDGKVYYFMERAHYPLTQEVLRDGGLPEWRVSTSRISFIP